MTNVKTPMPAKSRQVRSVMLRRAAASVVQT